jgi:long-chain acyl-CoA synthetase
MANDHWLFKRLEQFAEQTAIIWRDQQVSYADLLQDIGTWSEILDRHRIAPGECVAIYGDYTPHTCALLLALFFHRSIIVPLTYSVAMKKEECLDIAHVKAIFEFDHTHAWRFLRRPTGASHRLIRQLQLTETPGLVLFSSGSTGTSKASLLDLAKLCDTFQASRRAYRTLIFLLLDHIGGINTLFYILSHGGTMVTIESRTPSTVCEAIDRYRVQLLPTTPTFLNMLLISEGYKDYDLSSLELITYGTEPMPDSTLHHLCRVFPQTRLKQTYGLSELGILPTKSKDSSSLLLKVGGKGYETKIIDNVLWIRAETAMLGYLNAPSPFDAEGWFSTGDVVEPHGEYLRILGRQFETINVGGEKVYPAEVESVLLDMDNIEDVTVKGKANPVTGQVVIAEVRLGQWEHPDALRKRMRQFCKGRLAPYKIPTFVTIGNEPLHSERFKKVRVRTEA